MNNSIVGTGRRQLAYRCMLTKKRDNARPSSSDPVVLFALVRGGQEGDMSLFEFFGEVVARGYNTFLPRLRPVLEYGDDIVMSVGDDLSRMSNSGVILMDRFYTFNEVILHLDDQIRTLIQILDIARGFDMLDIE